MALGPLEITAATSLVSHRKCTGRIFSLGLPIFYHGKGGEWRRQFIGVPRLNSFHGPSANMILNHIPLIENFSMTSHKLLLGYYIYELYTESAESG